MKARTVIGVDPAFRKGGFAIAILDRVEKTCVFKMFADVIEFAFWLASEEAPSDDYFVCVENSNLQNVTLRKTGNQGQRSRKSRDIGKNQAASQLTVSAAVRTVGENRTVEISGKQKGQKLLPGIFLMWAKGWKFSNYKNIPAHQDKRDAFKVAMICAQICDQRLRKEKRNK